MLQMNFPYRRFFCSICVDIVVLHVFCTERGENKLAADYHSNSSIESILLFYTTFTTKPRLFNECEAVWDEQNIDFININHKGGA